MSKSLVIVESPAKAKTIEKYLGKGFEVLASVGHIMDLPKNDIGVELENRTFEPKLIVSPGKEKVVAQLKRAAAKADEIFLAPDPDREGEAIAYHLALQLGTNAKERKKIRRVTFNEITKKAVQEAFKHARDVDQNLVDAQQTRRVLDRLVGYQISPLLWDKVRRGLVGRPRADGGGAADCGTRAGDWRVSSRWSIGRWMRCCIRRGRRTRASRRALWASTASRCGLQTARTRTGKISSFPMPAGRAGDGRGAGGAGQGAVVAGFGAVDGAAAEAVGAVHHQPVAAGCGQQAWDSTCGGRWAWRSGCMKAWRSAPRARPA